MQYHDDDVHGNAMKIKTKLIPLLFWCNSVPTTITRDDVNVSLSGGEHNGYFVINLLI